MSFKGVMLDIDDTLYEYHPAHALALKITEEFLAPRIGIPAAQILDAFAEARHAIHRELSETASSHNRLLYFQRMFELLGINPLQHAQAAYELYWDTFIDQMVVRPGVFEFLAKLDNRKVCLVTDLTAHIQYRKIARLKLNEHASCLVTSEEAGREKPHPYIFMLALKKMGLEAHEVCMIGDSFEKDICGATSLGIRAFWLNPDGNRKNVNQLTTVCQNFEELAGYFR